MNWGSSPPSSPTFMALNNIVWGLFGWDTNRHSYVTSSTTPAYRECTQKFSPKSEHIRGLFLTPVLVIDALCPMWFCVSYIPSCRTKELIADHLRLVSLAESLTRCCNYRLRLNVHLWRKVVMETNSTTCHHRPLQTCDSLWGWIHANLLGTWVCHCWFIHFGAGTF